MNADVEKAVDILGQFVRGERNALGNTWGAEMAASKLAEVTQALRDQETDIARLAQESAQQFIRGREWAELSGRMEAERDALQARIDGAMVVKASRNGIVRSEARMSLIGKRVALVVLEDGK